MIHIIEAKCEKGKDDEPHRWTLTKYDDVTNEIWKEDVWQYRNAELLRKKEAERRKQLKKIDGDERK